MLKQLQQKADQENIKENSNNSETSQQQTSQTADIPWIADKMFSPKCDNLC